jgi:CheY-like chemotaxis protein
VLVIDDEPSIRFALRRYFAKRGWSVDEAEDVVVALGRLLSEEGTKYALIITDLRMPGLTGAELHDRVARERPALLGRLVFSTGDVVSAEAREFISRVSAPVLQKPFELATLDELLARYAARTS